MGAAGVCAAYAWRMRRVRTPVNGFEGVNRTSPIAMSCDSSGGFRPPSGKREHGVGGGIDIGQGRDLRGHVA
jgi:hypothetical protein